jgi:rhamnose utilization protein RhaD (predicted bifunctional aldolase and dehydrogenase)
LHEALKADARPESLGNFTFNEGMGVACRDVPDVNIRLCFEELYAREKDRKESNETQRRALKHELARRMKRAAEHVRPEMPWDEARVIMLDRGFSILKDMDARDAEQVGGPLVLCH